MSENAPENNEADQPVNPTTDEQPAKERGVEDTEPTPDEPN